MGIESNDPNPRRCDDGLEPSVDFPPGLSSKFGDRSDPPQSWSIDILRMMDWKRFEILAAAYYRHLGFRVETVDCGPDGGIDATLYEGDAVTPYAILQCKAWDQRVDVKPVRELLGVMAHRAIRRGIFLATSDFTSDAKAFATPNRIECISGHALLSRVDALSSGVQRELLALACEGDWTTPSCPSCGVKTVVRTAKDGRRFWGCQSYPRCKIAFPIAHDANLLSLEELPEGPDTVEDLDSSGRHQGAHDRLLAYVIGSLVILGLALALVRYVAPSIGEQTSRGSQALIQDAAKAQGAIQARSRQNALPTDDSRNAEARKKASEEPRVNGDSVAQHRAAAREAARKEAAWRDFHQRSARCAIEENQTTVECVNEYIRARRDFDHRWDSGQL
jgi:restriction endonuclease Mrr